MLSRFGSARSFFKGRTSMLYSFLVMISVGVFLAVFVAGMPTTIYLHRTATHRALTLHPLVSWVFKFVLWLTTGQFDKEWVAVHRKHHRFTDEVGDPHSPKLKGFWRVQLGNVFYYVREAKEMTRTGEIEKYSQGLALGWWDLHLFRYGLLGISVGILILVFAVGPMLHIGPWWALGSGAIHFVLYVFVFTSSINGLCHTKGYKNFNNTATNLRLLALLTGGEGLHNNHHGFPRSGKFSYLQSEFDPAWPIIKLLVLCKLAKVYKTINDMPHLADQEAW